MASDSTWISLHRCMQDWRWYKDVNTKSLFIHLLLIANHTPKNWKDITVKRGQKVTSVNRLSEETGISIRGIRTCIQRLERTGEIVVKTTNKYTIITIVNYDFYQGEGREGDKQTTNERQTNDKRTTTNKNDKELKNDKEDIYCPAEAEQIISYLNKKTGKHYKAKTDATVRLIKARMNDGFSIEDFKKVIDIKTAEWKHDDKMKNYLRPITLFSTKFESYLNSEVPDEAEKKRLAEEAGEIMEKGGSVW